MNTFPITDPEIILQCIPQRHPIVMVDHLLSYTPNSVVATHLVTENRLFTQAYLTEPGLIEHMAQSVALHTGYGYYIQNIPAPIGYIGSISNLKLHRLPKIGECITTEVTVLQEFGDITLVDIISKVDQEIIALGQMKTVKAP
jgi:3-hydroxyacyl-[acyl-carrier-protein] dehydratase